MSEDVPTLRPLRTLDRYGAASRCLLRLWQNEGNLSPSDDEFLRRFATHFPHWEARPGELDSATLAIVAGELGLAGSVEATRDYDAVLRAHRFGRAVIVVTEQPPLQETQLPPAQTHFMLLEQVDDDGFTLWCPFESGASDMLPRAARIWWEHWNALALVFLPATASAES